MERMVLDRIRIIDCTEWQQGPSGTMWLGDLGAEVIKVEPRVTGDRARGIKRAGASGEETDIGHGRNWYFESLNRNKKSITIDLTKEKGREIIYRLVPQADVFVHNYRLSTSAKLGIDYNTLARHNPKLIYATASGYGPLGPDRLKPGFDATAQARSGVMMTIGEPGMRPLSCPVGVADQVGGIILAYGILAALLARERLGIGQQVDSSLLGSMIALTGLTLSQPLLTGREWPRASRTSTGNPLWNIYKCRDGKWISLAMGQSDRWWPDFCEAMGITELRDDQCFSTMDKREENREQLISILDEVFSTRSSTEWVKIFEEKGDFIYDIVKTCSEVVEDPQVLENEYIVDYDHPILGKIRTLGHPVRFSKTPATIRMPTPEFGQHTEEILMQVGGYTWDEIANLKEEDAI